VIPGLDILAFADRSYLLCIGLGDKPSLITVGWYRWYPDFIELDRMHRGPWHLSNSRRFQRMSHVFHAATSGRDLTAAERELLSD
jgi:hypothetical protein